MIGVIRVCVCVYRCTSEIMVKKGILSIYGLQYVETFVAEVF